MDVKGLVGFLASEGISKDMYKIVEEPNYSEDKLKMFEDKYKISTDTLLSLNKLDLVNNHFLSDDDYVEWKTAYDDFKFYTD